MTYIALRMPTGMRLRTTAKLFVISFVLLTGFPAATTPIARDDVHHHISAQKAGTFRHLPKVDAPHWNGVDKAHGDWPANMILD
jgi:hypothetical protein